MGRSRFAVLLVLVAALGGTATTASAADKPYSLNLSPQTSAASTNQTFTARIVNRSANQSLGSLNLTAPAGFQLSLSVVLGVGSATTDGSTVFVRNLSLAPGQQVDVQVQADTTAVTGEWEWAALAKQANDFKGTGNDFTLDVARSDLSVTITPNGSTRPNGGSSVACPEETAGEPTASCRLQITHRGFVDGAAYTVTASVVANPDVPNNAGTLSLVLPSARNVACGVTIPSSPVTALTNGPLGRSKTVRFVVDLAAPLTSAPPGVCYAAPYPFATASPGAPFLEGSQLFLVGTLLPCVPGASLATPCASLAQLVGGDHVYEVQIPGLLPDPYIRG